MQPINTIARGPDAAEYELTLDWRLVTDGVMGGLSRGAVSMKETDGERCVCLRGRVRTENNGGFLQISANLPTSGSTEYTRYTGLILRLRGNGQTYDVHLKTSDLTSPWQSYRHSFRASSRWTEVRFPFAEFKPHRTSAPLKLSELKRLGIVAIGRAFEADLCVSKVCLYTGPESDAAEA